MAQIKLYFISGYICPIFHLAIYDNSYLAHIWPRYNSHIWAISGFYIWPIYGISVREGSLFQRLNSPKVRQAEDSRAEESPNSLGRIFTIPRFTSPKFHYSKGSISRRFSSPKVREPRSPSSLLRRFTSLNTRTSEVQ